MIKFIVDEPGKTDKCYRLAHFSDPHLSTLDEVRWTQMLNKRVLGYLSWRLNRRQIHRLDVLEKLLEDLEKQMPNHLVISGDLTHIGTPQEFKQVADWLSNLGAASEVSVIPGNHDSYIHEDYDCTQSLWSEYMSGDVKQENLFPSFRKRGPLAIIGLSTAVPTAPFFATGQLGEGQIAKMAEQLEHAGKQGLFRVVVLHHGPLQDSNKYRKRLVDAPLFRKAIQSVGAELILHGHGHYPVTDWLETEKNTIPVIGAASASQLSSSIEKRAGYNVYEVQAQENSWSLTVHSIRYDESSDRFTENDHREISLQRP